MIYIEDLIGLVIIGLELHVHGSEERLIQAARGDKMDGLEDGRVLIRSKKETRLEDYEEKISSTW